MHWSWIDESLVRHQPLTESIPSKKHQPFPTYNFFREIFSIAPYNNYVYSQKKILNNRELIKIKLHVAITIRYFDKIQFVNKHL